MKIKKKSIKQLSRIICNRLLKKRDSNSYYRSEDEENWTCYRSVTGFMNDKYFHVTFSQFRDEKPEIRIEQTTVCVQEVKDMINEFDHDIKIISY